MENHFSPDIIAEFLYPKNQDKKDYSIKYLDNDTFQDLTEKFQSWHNTADVSSLLSDLNSEQFYLSIFSVVPAHGRDANYSNLWNTLCSVMEKKVQNLDHKLIFLNEKVPGILTRAFSLDDFKNISLDIIKEFHLATGHDAISGISYYPCIEYLPENIFENSFKALVHAYMLNMLNEGKTAIFDSVSLNISSDEFFQNKDITNAIKELEHALKLNSTDTNVLNSLGVCYAATKEFDKSLHYFELAAEIAADDFIMPLYNIGLVHYLNDDKDKAYETFLKAAQTKANHYEIPFYLGKTELDLRNYDNALKYFQMAHNLNPENAAVLNYIGEVYLLKKDYDNSYEAYKKSLKLSPENPYALSAIGYIYFTKGENQEIAEIFLRQSTKIEPDNKLFRKRLGMIIEQKRRKNQLLKNAQAI